MMIRSRFAVLSMFVMIMLRLGFMIMFSLGLESIGDVIIRDFFFGCTVMRDAKGIRVRSG